MCQLVNKRNAAIPGNDVFSRADERLLEDFAVYCALGLEKFITQQIGDKTRANLDVTKEVGNDVTFSSHLKPLAHVSWRNMPNQQSNTLKTMEFPYCYRWNIIQKKNWREMYNFFLNCVCVMVVDLCICRSYLIRSRLHKRSFKPWRWGSP